MCSRHVIRAGAQAKSNNRQAVGGSVVQSVWRRSCGLPAPTANDMRPAVPALRCAMSFYANQHTWRRPLNYAPNTWHTHTHSQIHSTQSHTCRQTCAWVQQFVAYFQAPAEIRSRCVRLCKLFATRPEVAVRTCLPPLDLPVLAMPCTMGVASDLATHISICALFAFLLCRVLCGPARQAEPAKTRKEGEAKVERLGVQQSLKPHGKLAKEFYAANRCSNCAHLTLVRVCVLFLVESLIKFLINEISGMRMSVWAWHSWIPFLNILFMLPDTTIYCGT